MFFFFFVSFWMSFCIFVTYCVRCSVFCVTFFSHIISWQKKISIQLKTNGSWKLLKCYLLIFLWERFEPFIDVTLYCQINSERFVHILIWFSINFYSSQRQLLDQLPTQNSAPSNFTLTSTIQHRTNYSQWSSLLYLEIRGLRRTISVIMSSNIYLSMLNSLWFESED